MKKKIMAGLARIFGRPIISSETKELAGYMFRSKLYITRSGNFNVYCGYNHKEF